MKLTAATLTGVLAFAALPASAQTFSQPVRNVENPDRFPYSETLSVTIPTNTVNGIGSFPTVAGKRYVLEYLAVNCFTPSGTDSFPSVVLSPLKLTSPTSATFLNAPAVRLERTGPGIFGGFIWNGSAMLKLYADHGGVFGNGISINISHSDFSVQATCSVVLSGHTFAL